MEQEGITMTSSQAPIAAAGLRKSFGDTLALDSVDLGIAEGTIFALLGPNGAGKTTAVQTLSTLISPDGGEVRVAGFDVAGDPDAVRSAIGITGQFSAVGNLLTGEENLLLMADLYRLDRGEGRRRALTWLSAGVGLAAKSVEAASNLPTPVVLLPLISSGFVPTESMPAGMAWFAEQQPFTPIIETLRGLLTGTPIGNDAVVALAWCVVLTLAGYLWARDTS
jgi:hypothetical protein